MDSLPTKSKAIKKIENNKRMAVKSNAIVSGAYNLNLQAYRLFSFAVSKLNTKNKIDKRVKISAKEWGELFDILPVNRYREIVKAAETLRQAGYLCASDIHNQAIKKSSFISEYDYIESAIWLTWTDTTQKLLGDLQAQFTKVPLRYARDIHSVFALRLLEICLQFRSTGFRQVSVDDLKAMLGVENKYPVWKDFAFVLNKAITEIRKFTDYDITLIPIKGEKNKVVDVTFSISLQHAAQGRLDV